MSCRRFRAPRPPIQAEQPPVRPGPDFPAPPSLVPSSSGCRCRRAARCLPTFGVASMPKRSSACSPQPRFPHPRPTLAGLTARALAAAPGGDVPDLAVKAAALKQAGRVEEIISLLGDAHGPDVPGLAVVYALALFAAGQEMEACAVELGSPFPVAESEAARAASVIPAYCAALRGDDPAAVQALIREGRARLAQGLPRHSTLRPTDDVADYLSLKLNARLKLGGAGIRPGLAATATPELLYWLAHDEAAPPELRLAAAERAASLNVIAGEELARAYREAAAKLPRARSPGRRCGRGCSPPSRARPPPIFAPNPSPLCSHRPAIRGSRCLSRRLWREASAGLVAGPASRFLRRDRRQDRGPRRRRGERLGLDRHRRRAHAELAAPARGERSARPARRSRARGRHRHRAERRPAAAAAASPCHRARCARLRGADSAVG